MYIKSNNDINKDKNTQSDLNMNILTSIKTVPSLNSNEFINKNDSSILNLKNLSNIGKNSFEKKAYPTTTSNNSLSTINTHLLGLSFENHLKQDSIFKPMNMNLNSSPYFNLFHYFLTKGLTMPIQNQNIILPFNTFYLNLPNYNTPIIYNYNINNYNYFSPPNIFKKKDEEKDENRNDLLNKKRKFDNNISLFPKKIKENKIKNERRNLIDINKNNNKRELNENIKNEEIIEIKENFICNHNNCDINFKTQKLKSFHHIKMSPKCLEDSISFLKLIYQTKLLLLKNIEKDKKYYGKFSYLYENTMKDISLKEYINIYAGFKIKDNI